MMMLNGIINDTVTVMFSVCVFFSIGICKKLHSLLPSQNSSNRLTCSKLLLVSPAA